MYRIGEFSILKRTSIKTLRYYDEINLFKPTLIDKYTGYRYYSDEQMKDFDRINYYKDLGFSLEEIKKLQEEENKDDILVKKRNELIAEIKEKESQLNRIIHIIEKTKKIEFRPYQESPIIAKKITLKKREDYWEEIEKVKEEIEKEGYTPIHKIISNLELGYVEEDIDVLVGYTVEEKKKPREESNLLYIGSSKAEKQLVGKGKIYEIETLYEEMIQYAHDNNIQIRGFFTGVINNKELEMYVEAFDLNEVNEDAIYYLDHFQKETELDNSLIGTYKIREILPNTKYMFNPNKQKSILDTKFKTLELKENGKTNYEDISWNKKELLLKYDNREIPLPFHIAKVEGKEYLLVLMNESFEFYKSQRPMEYLYIKTK